MVCAEVIVLCNTLAVIESNKLMRNVGIMHDNVVQYAPRLTRKAYPVSTALG